ncbi:MAG: hypothetical protein SNJ79_08855 [Sphingomonadaceae bacterium]
MKTMFATLAALVAAPALAQMTPAPGAPGQPAATQEMRAERVDSEAKARARLGEMGYSVERIEQRGDGSFAATAVKDNERKQLIVHADGRVTPAS